MNSLFNKISKLKKKIDSIELDENSMIIFAIGPEEKWNEDAEEFEGIDNTKIEAYSVPGNLKKYFDRAKNLKELKALGEKYNFNVHVFGIGVSIKELWSDEI